MAKRKYTTKSGDMWDMISFRVYGSELFVSELMQANPDYVGVVVFNAGVTLNIPEVTPVQRSAASLPPWRRNNE